jgi:hypothetical protein
MMPDYEAGAKILDKKYPGWRNKININALDMAVYTNCILGQIYGEYKIGKATLWPNTRSDIVDELCCKFGFDAQGKRDEWIKIINKKPQENKNNFFEMVDALSDLVEKAEKTNNTLLKRVFLDAAYSTVKTIESELGEIYP